MVLYIVDPFQNAHFRVLHRELENAGMRLNEHQPSIFVNRTERGGIEVPLNGRADDARGS